MEKFNELQIGDTFHVDFCDDVFIVHHIGLYKDGISKAYYTTESNGKEFVASHHIIECRITKT